MIERNDELAARRFAEDETAIAPIHPGEILREEFLVPLGITANRLALDVGVTSSRITEILNGKRSITAETALRLGRYFDLDPQFWISLQTGYDLRVAARQLGDRLDREVRPLRKAG
jgi:addiction module HigA family antidote